MNTAAAASKAVIGSIGFGLFGGLQRTALGSRFCLLDNDRDGRVDQAVLAGAKRSADLVPQAIPPTAVKVTEHAPLDGPSEVTLRYLGKVGMIGNIGFELSATEAGRKLPIADCRTVLKPGDLPKAVTFHGARFEVLSFDPARQTARAKIVSAFPAGPYSFIPPPQTIYIYIPR